MARTVTKENRTMRNTTFGVILGIMMLSAMTFAQNVTYDFDKTANFSRIRTYAWIPGTTGPDALNHKRVVEAVGAQLASRRIVQVSAPNPPDLFIAYHASFDRDVRITGFASGWGGYRFPGNRTA